MKVFIMAGGSGTRLAPLSLTIEGKLPKQFLALVGEKTLLQEAVERIPAEHQVIVIPEEKYLAEVASQVGAQASILTEPFGCNTATAIALAIKDLEDREIALFLPADHMMSKDVFQDIFRKIDRQARTQEKIITIGITPDRAETGYGYIKVRDQINEQFYEVDSFVEKPDLTTANQYLKEGGYYWNAGMFCFQAGVMKKALAEYAADIWDTILNNEVETAYSQIKEMGNNISIDYAVMEKIAENILLYPAPLELQWNDVGGWKALQKYLAADASNNYLYGRVNVSDCENCQIMNYNQQVELEVSGLQSALVINTISGLLITPMLEAARAKELIPAMESGDKTMIKEAERVQIEQKEPHFTAVIGYSELEIINTSKKIEVKGLKTTM